MGHTYSKKGIRCLSEIHCLSECPVSLIARSILESWPWSLALIFASALSGLATHHIPLAAFWGSGFFRYPSALFLPLILRPPMAVGEECSPSCPGSAAEPEMEVALRWHYDKGHKTQILPLATVIPPSREMHAQKRLKQGPYCCLYQVRLGLCPILES